MRLQFWHSSLMQVIAALKIVTGKTYQNVRPIVRLITKLSLLVEGIHGQWDSSPQKALSSQSVWDLRPVKIHSHWNLLIRKKSSSKPRAITKTMTCERDATSMSLALGKRLWNIRLNVARMWQREVWDTKFKSSLCHTCRGHDFRPNARHAKETTLFTGFRGGSRNPWQTRFCEMLADGFEIVREINTSSLEHG